MISIPNLSFSKKIKNNRVKSMKKGLRYYQLESLLYRISDHSPKKFYKRTHYGDKKILSVEEGRKHIISYVNSDKPFMVGRYGTSEGRALAEYHEIRLGLRKDYLPRTKHFLCCNAGFFPDDTNSINKWGELLTDLSSECNILGVMNFYCEGWIAENLCPNAILMPNGGIASASKGYTHCFEGKKILVVHPMNKTIESQYFNKRELIFPGSNALPEFDLQTLKAINTQADETDDRFKTWFDALDYMTEEVAKRDFDIALIGCGAYGFPLAARVKQMGKSAIHMAGAVQHLFGIKSARGNANSYIRNLYNEAWVYPDESDRPKGSEKIEGGCYWAPQSK